MTEQSSLDAAYSQRNWLAIAFAKMAILAGYNAGRGIDNDPDKAWDPEWRHVVYVDLPGGQQVSWHIAPSEIHLLEGVPHYPGNTWDGKYTAHEPEWPDLIDMTVEMLCCRPGGTD